MKRAEGLYKLHREPEITRVRQLFKRLIAQTAKIPEEMSSIIYRINAEIDRRESNGKKTHAKIIRSSVIWDHLSGSN